MAGVEVKNVGSPDETRSFGGKGEGAVLDVSGHSVLYGRFDPGWRWSEHIKPVAKTDSCQVEHIGYCVSGSFSVSNTDGSQQHIGPGMVYRIAPGHDGWNDGSEPAVCIEFQGAANFAKG